MKKQIFTLILFLFVNVIYAQNPLVKQWDYRFGGTGGDKFYSIKQTDDGGYIIGGYSGSFISGDKTQSSWGGDDYWVVKTDSLGNKQWDKDFGGTMDDYFSTLQQTSDGGFILGGISLSGIGGDKTQNIWGNYDYWIIKIDSQGTKQWDKDFGTTGLDFFSSIQQTADGGYILGGSAGLGISGDKTQPTWGGFDYWIVKTDSLGNKQWDKDFGGSSWDILLSLQQTTDRGYILGGYSWSGAVGDKTQPVWGGRDYWIVKIDSLGNKQWDKDFGGLDDEQLSAIQQTADGGYILGGWSLSDTTGGKKTHNWGWDSIMGTSDYWIIKTDSLGSMLWERDFGGTHFEELNNISQTSDGGFMFSGDSRSDSSGNKTENNLGTWQTWIVKTDSLGNIQWDKTIFTLGWDDNGLAIQTKDGCYVVANKNNSIAGGYKTQNCWNNGDDDYWIVKFCDTTSTTSIQEIPNTTLINVFPNPITNELKVKTNNSDFSEIILYDIASRKLLQQKFINSTTINTKQLSKGIYLYEVRNKNGVIKKGKVVKE